MKALSTLLSYEFSVQRLIDLYAENVTNLYGNFTGKHTQVAVKSILELLDYLPVSKEGLRWYHDIKYQTILDLNDMTSFTREDAWEDRKFQLARYPITEIPLNFVKQNRGTIFNQENLEIYSKNGIEIPSYWIPWIDFAYKNKQIEKLAQRFEEIKNSILKKLHHPEEITRNGILNLSGFRLVVDDLEKRILKSIQFHINKYRRARLNDLELGNKGIDSQDRESYQSIAHNYRNSRCFKGERERGFLIIKNELDRFFCYSINNKCHVLGTYFPKNSRNASNCEFSKMIIELKKRNPLAIETFSEFFAPIPSVETVIVGVPSSKPDERSGVRMLAMQVAKTMKCSVLSGLLKRIREMPKKSMGGERDYHADLESLELREPQRFEGKNVLLIDDIITTGTSMRACENIIRLQGKPIEVFKVAIGKTDYKENSLVPF